MKRMPVFAILLAAFGLTACGEFDAAGVESRNGSQSVKPVIPYGTCDRKDVLSFNLCVESVGSDYSDPAYLRILQSSCQSTGGVYSTNNCERAGSVGTCVVSSGQSNETHVTYYPAQYTAATAQAACAATPGGVYYAN